MSDVESGSAAGSMAGVEAGPSRPRGATAPGGQLHGLARVTFVLESFVNVDLFERGVYELRLSVATAESNVPARPTSCSKASAAPLTKALMTHCPLHRHVRSGSGSGVADGEPGVVVDVCSSDAVDESSFEAEAASANVVSRPYIAGDVFHSAQFEIRYQAEAAVLNDVVVFEVALAEAASGVCEDMLATVELWYSTEFNGQALKCAAVRRYLLASPETTVHAHAYYEVTFGESFFGLLHLLAHSALVALTLQAPPLPRPRRQKLFPAVFPPHPTPPRSPKSVSASVADLVAAPSALPPSSVLDRLAAAYKVQSAAFCELWATCSGSRTTLGFLIASEPGLHLHPRARDLDAMIETATALADPARAATVGAEARARLESGVTALGPDACETTVGLLLLDELTSLADALDELHTTYVGCLILAHTPSLRQQLRTRFERYRLHGWADNVFRYHTPLSSSATPGLASSAHLFNSQRMVWHRELAGMLAKVRLAERPRDPIVDLSPDAPFRAKHVVFQDIVHVGPDVPPTWNWAAPAASAARRAGEAGPSESSASAPATGTAASGSSSSRLSDSGEGEPLSPPPAYEMPSPAASVVDEFMAAAGGGDDQLRVLGLEDEETLLANVPEPSLAAGTVHLFVYVHGLAGNAFDLRLLRNELAILFPEAEHLLSAANEKDTLCDIDEMAERLAHEIWLFVRSERLRIGALSFVGHSLGTIIVRAALSKRELCEFLPRLHAFVSLSGPHCGTMFGSSTLVGSAMWLLKKWKRSTCLAQLSLTDADTLEETFMYKLAHDANFGLFSVVLLVSSPQDRYVPYASSRMELSPEALYSKEKGSAYLAILDALFTVLASTTVIRTDVMFDVDSLSLDSMVGRAAHILMLDSTPFLAMFATLARNYLVPTKRRSMYPGVDSVSEPAAASSSASSASSSSCLTPDTPFVPVVPGV
ncbi:uncharacterized protein AMSG_04169 [Thecamonas trahens ATCC 50062]|uniref:DUF676 domain-containing protein n=1 Tax=Thecamonas trahens ATCC 50062 TaxID=461836 RepID=A0A0L0D6F6_THETB|nr:hypothetical protein AMSG_04169 [Thecamonas trahens ATCC 50062]KNC47934.1 hypothetical protein AMSG_04169 [Thecamonas trahens ATCC 50062]|eukprot:XP_013758953.1 hypothetical protein AMSG_04169 [Thecamonas trahens ATCC 50062]